MGIGFVVRPPTDEEKERLASDSWKKSWVKGPEHKWYRRFTPGQGITDTIDRFTCAGMFRLVGGLVLTNPARFAIRAAPGIAVAGYLVNPLLEGAQSWYLESRIQGSESDMLDAHLQSNLLLKPLRIALARKEIDREEARRQAHLLLKDSEQYYRRLREALPKKGSDAAEEEAFLLWSLQLSSFADLQELYASREITIDEDRYGYPKDFSNFVSDDQMQQLIYLRHRTLLRMRGGEFLLGQAAGKIPPGKVDTEGEKLRQSKAVRAVLEKYRAGKIDETEARKWIHTYLDFEQELGQANQLGIYKKSAVTGPDGRNVFVDTPLTLDKVESDILLRLNP